MKPLFLKEKLCCEVISYQIFFPNGPIQSKPNGPTEQAKRTYRANQTDPQNKPNGRLTDGKPNVT